MIGEKNILVLVFVALLILSTLFAVSVMANNIFSDIFSAIGEWFKKSPLSGLFYTPIKRNEAVAVVFYPRSFSMSPEEYVNISYNGAEIYNFKGTIAVGFENDTFSLAQKGTMLRILGHVKPARINNIVVKEIDISNVRVEVFKDGWNETSANGSIRLENFLGTAIIGEDFIRLEGNATRFSKR